MRNKRIKFEQLGGFLISLEKQIRIDVPSTFLANFSKDLTLNLKKTSSASRSIPNSIKSKRWGRNRVSITAVNHWFIADQDIKPKTRFLPVELFQIHESNPGETVGKKVSDFFSKKEMKDLHWVSTDLLGQSKVKGFVNRAKKMSFRKINKIFNKSIKEVN